MKGKLCTFAAFGRFVRQFVSTTADDVGFFAIFCKCQACKASYPQVIHMGDIENRNNLR